MCSDYFSLYIAAQFLGICNSLLMGLGQDQQPHPAVYAGVVSKGGSVAKSIGVIDMRHVTGDTLHVTPET